MPVPGYTVDRTSSSHVHHWAEVVTHANVLQNYQQEVQAKAPEAVAQRKNESLLVKENNANLRKRLREEENSKKAAERHLQKVDDKNYLASLSVNDRKIVREQKREEAAEKKRCLEEKRTEKLQQAIEKAPELAKSLKYLNINKK